MTLKVEHARCAQRAERGQSGPGDASLGRLDELARDEPVSAAEADQNNAHKDNHETRGGRRTHQLARRVGFFRLPERLLKPRDGSRRHAIQSFAGEFVRIQRRQRQDAAGPDLNHPQTAERLRSDGPGVAALDEILEHPARPRGALGRLPAQHACTQRDDRAVEEHERGELAGPLHVDG